MTPRGGSPQLTFRAGRLTRDLHRRVGTTPEASSMAQVAQRDLERYYALLASGAREVADLRLTINQASAICDALSSPLILDPAIRDGLPLEPIAQVAAELVDADRLGAKWKVDVPLLVARLRTLSPLGQYFLVDAVERFWLHTERDSAEVLGEVGLVSG